jgi:hypothetical protein
MSEVSMLRLSSPLMSLSLAKAAWLVSLLLPLAELMVLKVQNTR